MIKKQKKTILFIYPNLVTEAPITLATLGAFAKQMGWKVATSVNTFRKPLKPSDFVAAAKKTHASLVSISMFTFQVLEQYKIIAELKKAGFLVVVGGPHPTDRPQE